MRGAVRLGKRKEVMKNYSLLGLCLIMGNAASAEGFLCSVGKDPGLNVYVEHYRSQYKKVAKSLLVYRNILDDYTGDATIEKLATFSRKDKTLNNDETNYHAQVKFGSDETGAPGAYLLGTQLQNIEYLSLTVQFSYDKPVVHLTQLPGLLYAMKRDGTSEVYPVDCLRFLKDLPDSENEGEVPGI
jgi:hypothetical protein